MITWKRSTIFLLTILFFNIIIALFGDRQKYELSEFNCESKPLRENWSSGRAYKATLWVKNCNSSETLFYSVRLDHLDSKASTGWFVPGYDLENDEYPEADSEINWVNSRKLQVLIHTRTLSGTLSLNVGDDLIIVRSYIAKEPLAFPNY